MRAAPPVSVRCGDGRLWLTLCTAIAAVAAAAFAYWALLHRAGPGSHQPMAPAWAAAAAAVAACLAWRLGPRGTPTLRWDGQAWALDDEPGSVQVAIDLDRWLLLKFSAAGARRVRWLALSARQGSAAWHPLRAALYSPAPRTSPSAASGPDRGPE